MACSSVQAMDHVTLRRDGRNAVRRWPHRVDAQDGGLLFLARDGVLWRILPTELVKRTTDDAPFRAYPAEQMTKSVLADLPKGFTVYADGALPDRLRHLAGLCPVVRSVVRTALRRIPQRLEPPGL